MTETGDSREAPVSAPNATDQAATVDSPGAQNFAARRAELGMSLEDVAHQLKFAVRQIEALEAGDFAKLPGGTFARGMVRGYARLLKLDPAPVLAQLTASGVAPQAAPEQAVSLRTPIPFSEGGKHVNLVYAVVSAVILAVVAFFAVEWYQERNGTPKLAFVSAARDMRTDAGGAATNDVPAQTATTRDAPEAVAPAAAPVLQAAAPAGPPAAKPVVALPPTPTLAATALPAGKRRIVMRFEKESWVEVKAGNGMTLISQINPAGTEKVIEGDPPFSLIIGNAANVRLTYNEQPVDLRPYFRVDVARLKLD